MAAGRGGGALPGSDRARKPLPGPTRRVRGARRPGRRPGADGRPAGFGPGSSSTPTTAVLAGLRRERRRERLPRRCSSESRIALWACRRPSTRSTRSAAEPAMSRSEFEIRLLSHLGHHRCDSCGAAQAGPRRHRRRDPASTGSSASSFSIDGVAGPVRDRLGLPGLYNVYNALAATAAALALGVEQARDLTCARGVHPGLRPRRAPSGRHHGPASSC